jgi:iron complex outermembrane receptor protein
MKRVALLLLLTFMLSTTVFAQESYNDDAYYALIDTVKKIKGKRLKEVNVAFLPQNNPVNIGKAGIKTMDLPQASAIISSTVLTNQQTNSLSDILKNANGVYIMGTTGGYQEEIASRGFPLSSSNTFKNGIRYFNGMSIETSGLEKVELLKGSAALLFGNVAPGGILNLITKKPKNELGGEIGIRYGSFNTIKPNFDIYNSIGKNKNLSFRINGSYEKGDSFRDFVHSERSYINPSFLIKLSNKTELLLEADYIKDNRTPDFGAGIYNYEFLDLPRSRFLGVSWGYYNSKQALSTATLTHTLSENWSVSFINSIRFFETDLFSNTRPNPVVGGNISANGDWTRSIQRTENKDNYFIQQADLKGKFQTGKINHQFLFGYDIESFKTYTTAYKNYMNYDVININSDYNPSLEPAIPTLDKNTLTTTPINRFGVYLQDLTHLTDKFKLLAGIRYSYQETKNEVLSYATNNTSLSINYDGAFSPRLGLIYQPSTNVTLFTSYSNSFEINTGQDELGNALKPSIIDQFEVGVKTKIVKERLYLNLTGYQITNENFYQQSLNNGNTYSYIKVLAGEVQSKGVEIDVIANPIKGLSILAGYSFNETKYVKSTYFIEGSQLKYNPKNTANFNINYNFEGRKLNGLSVGLINTYFGTRYAGRPTRVQVANDSRKLIYVPDYFQIDATMAYTFSNWTLRAKISNLLNELNYNIHDDNSLNPIAPRNYTTSLTYNF